MKYVYKFKDCKHFEKSDVKMWKYFGKDEVPQASFLYQEVDGGHYDEFVNTGSSFIYYILEGAGVFIIEDKRYPVESGDVVVIPPGKRFYYEGNMKQLLVNAPAWEERSEKILRKIKPQT